MARDFSKNTSNYMLVGQNAIGTLLDGAAYVMVSAWINYDTVTASANQNRLLNVVSDSNTAGLFVSLHNGTSSVLSCNARSVSTDGLQSKSGTTVLSSGTWYQVGAIFDFAGDTITPYVNGVAEGGGSVTFGNSSYTDGTPALNEIDAIGCAAVSPAGAPSTTNIQFDGRIAELAIWASATAFTAADQEAMAARIAPNLVRRDALKVYFPLRGTDSPEKDNWGGLSGTITGTVSAADHPNIIYPSGVISVQKTVSAVTTRSRVLGGGVRGVIGA